MQSWRTVAFLILLLTPLITTQLRTDNEYWTSLAKQELAEALQVKWNLNIAKNVIIFIGDGMGPNTVTATRLYKGGESHRLVFEKFPHVGLLKTYSANKMVPDSSCSGTALLCGVKVNQETIGVDASVQMNDCLASLRPEARLKSLAVLAQESGKSTGIVTTMRVTHATPGPVYAHSANRKWESNSKMPESAKNCKDIARQLVEDLPGKNLNVIMGGGRQMLISNATGTKDDPIDLWAKQRTDGINLINEYKKDKEARGLRYAVVNNSGELQNINIAETDYLLGIFANGHMQLEHERNKSPQGMPSISEMTRYAIKILQKNKNGYFLMVEGGNIDFMHHFGMAKKAINEAAAMEEAVKVAIDLTNEEDTLLIVTSDHTHTLNINGYPQRGTDIFDVTKQLDEDGRNYTTLTYSTGGPKAFQFEIRQDNNVSTVVRRDPSLDDTKSFNYRQQAAIKLAENSHGGGDVLIYARGPFSHLFHNVHEQHYVFHAVSYAAQLGAYAHSSAHTEQVLFSTKLTLLLVVLIAKLL